MTQLSLLSVGGPRIERFELPDADVRLVHDFLPEPEARALFEHLQFQVQWRQDTIVVFGRRHLIPRLQQWYGDPGLSYTYSGIRMNPEPWAPSLLPLKEKVEQQAGAKFNTVLLNFYRNGEDTVGWHSDDEPELGVNPTIASVSLGTEREFLMKNFKRPELGTTTVPLEQGSLLVMSGSTQAHWLHSVPRRKGVKDPRINLTFRYVHPPKQRATS